ncbi:cytochrome P450 1A2-like isoform X1 [Ruditapes philippinarum]|uniref:cytochrome P450 1A2-like isoform X1 n=1 Tax=Ruditapes philippinarum TaxID=129788 RepID=UPI00295B7E3C|nr:cytochrome P450 1A2-like isoform X1 [Ruditapes philippinarum]
MGTLMIIIYIILALGGLLFFIKRKIPKGKIIAGPKGLPVLGCIHEIDNETIHFKFSEWAEKFGDIFRVKMFSDNFIVLNTEENIRKAFGSEKYKNHFGDRVEMFWGEHFRCHNQSLAFVSDGSGLFHRIARKSYMQALHTYGSGLQELENNVMTEMSNLIERIEKRSGKEFECVSMLQRSLSNVMSLVLRGELIPDSDPDSNMFWDHVHANDFFLTSYVNFVMSTFPFLRFLPGKYGDEFRKGKKANAKIAQKYFYDMKKTYRPGLMRGLVDHFLEEQEKQMHSDTGLFFTDERIIAQIVETIDAGMTTSWATLSNTMLALLNYPQCQEKIQNELDDVIGRDRLPTYGDRESCKYFQAFEMEVHRYLTVVPLALPHLCKEHIDFEGYDIEPNSTVFANVWYVHHNKEIWGDPWVFRPERFLSDNGDLVVIEHKFRRSLIAFGYGLRQCPGEMFAKTRYFLYISSLLQRWKFEFPPGKEIPCDPRKTENFDIKIIMRAHPFYCIAKERK